MQCWKFCSANDIANKAVFMRQQKTMLKSFICHLLPGELSLLPCYICAVVTLPRHCLSQASRLLSVTLVKTSLIVWKKRFRCYLFTLFMCAVLAVRCKWLCRCDELGDTSSLFSVKQQQWTVSLLWQSLWFFVVKGFSEIASVLRKTF